MRWWKRFVDARLQSAAYDAQLEALEVRYAEVVEDLTRYAADEGFRRITGIHIEGGARFYNADKGIFVRQDGDTLTVLSALWPVGLRETCHEVIEHSVSTITCAADSATIVEVTDEA